jgi:peptidyl-prolyl cis-trans isomerase B (cyclophilin B)
LRAQLPLKASLLSSDQSSMGKRLTIGLAILALACGSEAELQTDATDSDPVVITQKLILPGPHSHAILEIEGMGEIRLRLLPEIAPETVDNFIKLASSGFFEGTSFHRIIPGFMVQGGDPLSKDPDPRKVGNGGPGYKIKDEFNSLPHLRGTVSMANEGRPSSAGSQFFIVHQDSLHLDGKYTAFAQVVEGIEVVDRITEVEIDQYGRFGPPDRPHPKQVVIKSIRIETAATGLVAN